MKSSRSIIGAYLVTNGLATLAASLIWGVNTLFLLSAGLDIFEVMIVNATFTVGQVVFEVPTGVVADTIGRRASLLLAASTLIVSTLMYVAADVFSLGLWFFILASVLLGLGYTFQTGADAAWLVDALDSVGYSGAKDRVFAWGGMTMGATMVVGSILGGVVGQIDLRIPYYARAVAFVLCLAAIAAMVRDAGFVPRPLKVSTFGSETRKIAQAGARFGWGDPVVRPLMIGSLLGGVFFMYGFYAWQRYALDLLGQELIWVSGLLAALMALSGIVGNAFVGPVMREGDRRRRSGLVLAVVSGVSVIAAVGMGLVGLLVPEPGLMPFLIASALWVVWGVAFGMAGPIRQGYINSRIPSQQRATVLSLDALFGDVGGSAGQPALGWISRGFGIPVGWLVGTAFLAVTPLTFLRADAAERAEVDPGETRE